MKKQRFKMSRLQSAFAGAAMLTGVAGIGMIAHAAVAPANSNITNQATVSYEDQFGNDYSATSNNAVVTVAQVYAATIGQDVLSTVAGPAQTVYFTHTITNNGNGTDVFHVTVANDAALATDSGDFTNISVYLDGSATAASGTVTTNNCAGINGQADPGEILLSTTATLSNTVTIPAGQQACIVVAATIPATATNTQTYDLTVTAQAENGNAGAPQAGSVDDVTTGNGVDTVEDTNNDRVTITADAALQVTKSILGHTLATATTDGEITYQVEVQNTGAATAQQVFIFDGLPANTTLVPGSVLFNGSATALGNDFIQATATNLTEANLDALVGAPATNPVDLNGDGDATDATESDIGIDLDGNGTVDAATRQGVFVFDEAIAPSTTVTLQFKVSYSRTLPGGTSINNAAHAAGDGNGDGDTADAGENPSSGTVPVSTPTIRNVEIDDTETAANGDEDNLDNDVQTIAQAPEGGVVIFNNQIINQGNATDDFTVTVVNDGGAAFNTAGGAYPALLNPGVGSVCDGTAAHHFPISGTFNYTVTNTSGVPYPGGVVPAVTAGQVVDIQIRIQLPSGSNGAGEYCASTRVVSNNDASAQDFKLERLTNIIAPAVDLADGTDVEGAPDADAFPAVGSITPTSPLTTLTGNPGQTVVFNLELQNDGGASESFTLSAGSTWNGGTKGGAGFNAGTLGALYPGWSIVFKDTGGTTITSTPSVPAGGTFEYTAEVTIPATATDTQSTFAADIDGDATNDPIDGNADGDNDYAIIFQITGNNSGAKDVVLDAVDVNEVEAIVINPNGNGQVEPGGTVTYVHTIENNGNTDEDVSVTTQDDRDGTPTPTVNDFNQSVVRIDTNCNGTFDTILNASYTGAVCLVSDGAGPATGTVTAGLIDLAPNQDVSVQVTVSAQTTAPQGVTNTTAVTASWDGGADTDTATDSTIVVTVQLRADKYAALDAACDGTPDTAFVTNLASNVAPGQCVIWQIIVENESSNAARNVIVEDAAPSFTTYQAGSLETCAGQAALTTGQNMAAACPSTDCTLTDAIDADAACTATHDAHATGADVYFYVGHADGGNPAPDGDDAVLTNNKGGTLSPSEFVSVRFRVRLDSN